MSALDQTTATARLISYYEQLAVPKELLDIDSDLFEVATPADPTGDRLRMYRPVALKTPAQVLFFNKALLQHVWHWKDVIENHGREARGMDAKQSKKFVESFVAKNRSLQMCGYLANLIKHGQVTKFPHLNKEAPRLGNPCAMMKMPNGMWMSIPITDAGPFAVSAPEQYIQSVEIEGANDTVLGHTRHEIDRAANAWLSLLTEWKVLVPMSTRK